MNYLIEEIKQNELKSKKHKKICATLNYIQHFFILASIITGCVSISAFSSLVGVPIEIASSPILLKICARNARIKKYMLIIKKQDKKSKKKKQDKYYC